MRARTALILAIPLLAAGLATGAGPASAATTLWPTYHLDPGRSGNDTGEPSFAGLGNVWNSGVLDGTVFAEPLVDGNIVIVATENNSLYGFNAVSGALQWSVHLGAPRISNFPCGDINPLGITGTPVIDGGFLFAVDEVQTSPTTFVFNLAKVNPSNGALVYNDNITPIGMDTNVEQERSALAVSNGNVVVLWGGLDGDCGMYHGYVETVSEPTGVAQHQFSDTTGGREGGMWAPSGAAVDGAGNIYVNTGNGSSTDITMYDYGDSVLKFPPTLGSAPASFFAPGAPQTWASLNASDSDLGSMGPSLLPSGLLFAIGKGGRGYLLNQGSLPSNSMPGGGENHSAPVCHATSSAAFGGLALSGNTVFVPCADGIAAVSIDSASAFHTLWYQTAGGGSAPIVAGGLVWTLAMFGGNTLYGLAAGTGQIAETLPLPATTNHFATPAAGDGLLFVGAANRLAAFAPRFSQSVGQPATAVTPAGIQIVFWRGAGNHLLEAWWNGSWNGPVDVTSTFFGGRAQLSSAPTVAVAPDGTQIVFWAGASGHLFEAWWNGAWNGPVDNTADFFGGTGSLASAPSVAVTAGGTQVVFWEGASGHLYEAWWNGSWNGPVDNTADFFGGRGALASAPSVAVTGGTQIVFWRSASGALVEAWWNGAWNGPVDNTADFFGGRGALASAPSVAVTAGGAQIVFWAGVSGHLTEAWWNGSWNGPVDDTVSFFGGAAPLASPPGVAVTPAGAQIVFWAGASGHLTEAWWNGAWNGPVEPGN